MMRNRGMDARLWRWNAATKAYPSLPRQSPLQYLLYTTLVPKSTGGSMDYAPWEGKRIGSYGEGAGVAYVFSRSAAAEGYVWGQDQVFPGRGRTTRRRITPRTRSILENFHRIPHTRKRWWHLVVVQDANSVTAGPRCEALTP